MNITTQNITRFDFIGGALIELSRWRTLNCLKQLTKADTGYSLWQDKGFGSETQRPRAFSVRFSFCPKVVLMFFLFEPYRSATTCLLRSRLLMDAARISANDPRSWSPLMLIPGSQGKLQGRYPCFWKVWTVKTWYLRGYEDQGKRWLYLRKV